MQKQIKIVLVDDDPDEESIFQIALDFLGIEYDFLYFEKAYDFVSYIENEANLLPDIVFIDMKMPQISGKDLIKKIRENQRFDSMQAIIYTAHINEQDKNAMTAMGIYEFFIKPTEFSELTEMLKVMIDRGATSAENKA
jgi:DNA-binding NtrC family response regulator